MKFSTYLTQIQGVSVYSTISLLVFVAFAVVVSYYVFKMKPDEVEHKKNLPFN